MSSTYYRDRDRDWDTRSHGGGDRPRNTTVRRYVINEDDDDDRYESKTKLKVTTREGERSRSNVREYYERDHDHRDSRETVYRRETSPDQYREIRITRDMSPRDPEPRSPPYELERVTRSTEYFREPERQQPIYIRTEAPPPIIIREQAPQQIVIRDRSSDPPRHEERREESRSEYESQRQVARRDPSSDQDEDYYYERRVRRIERRDEEQDREPDRRSRRDHSDDDEEYYYRKTTDGYGSDPDMHGPDHRRHLAEGAIAGGAIAGLMRHRRKKNGQDHSGKAAGAGQVAGGAALGALAAEGISRVRSHYRSKSRPRSAIGDDDDRGRRDRDDGSRSRSRSHSGPNRKDLAKLGAIAAIGAVAGYAASKRGKKGGADDRRSRSRRRRGSRDRSLSSEGSGSDHKKGGNKATIAGAGLASAAVAGIVEHVRNKSKGPGRSKSKTRAAIPIAAAGLGGAALAGLYERNKEQKRERERQARSRSRSRSVARRGSPTYEAARGDQNLIEYRSGNYYEGRNRRGSSASISPARRLRSRSRGAEDMDEAGQGAYAAHQRRERRRAERAQRRKLESTARLSDISLTKIPEQEEDRNDTPHGMPAPAYGFGPYAEPMPEQNAAAPQYAPNQYYPQNNSFPPPPQNAYSPTPNIVNHETPYHPADFPQNPPYVPPPHAPEPYYPQQGPQPPYNGGDPGYRGNVSSYIPERYVPGASDCNLGGLPEETDANEKQ